MPARNQQNIKYPGDDKYPTGKGKDTKVKTQG
ncbi:unnamed protein product, partial [marine sediment metagenome]